jgi:hypothetical protein
MHVKYSARRLATLAKGFHDFPELLETNSEILLKSRPQLIPCITFPVSY